MNACLLKLIERLLLQLCSMPKIAAQLLAVRLAAGCAQLLEKKQLSSCSNNC
jgi:hypothetical protein